MKLDLFNISWKISASNSALEKYRAWLEEQEKTIRFFDVFYHTFKLYGNGWGETSDQGLFEDEDGFYLTLEPENCFSLGFILKTLSDIVREDLYATPEEHVYMLQMTRDQYFNSFRNRDPEFVKAKESLPEVKHFHSFYYDGSPNFRLYYKVGSDTSEALEKAEKYFEQYKSPT